MLDFERERAADPRSRARAPRTAHAAPDGNGSESSAAASAGALAASRAASSLRAIFLPLGLTLAMLCLVWLIAPRPPTLTAPNAHSTSVRSIYRTSAVQLYRDYNRDEAATQARIGPQRIAVTGTVAAVSQDYLGNNEVLLDVGNGLSAAEMALQSDQNLLAVQLQRGESVTILCDQMQRLTDAPEGSGCRLLEPRGDHTASEVAPDHRPAQR